MFSMDRFEHFELPRLGKEEENFLGISLVDKAKKEELSPSRCNLCGEVFKDPKASYWLIKPATASSIVTNEIGDPLIVSNKSGKGEVIFAAFPYLQNSGGTCVMEICKHIIDHIMERISMVEIEGRPIEYIVNKTKEGMIVSVINNRADVWKGRIIVEKSKIKADKIGVLELWEGKEAEYRKRKGRIEIVSKLNSFDFKVYELGEVKPRRKI